MDILYALHRIDLRLFHRIFQQGERGILRPLARALSHSADGYLMLLVPLLLFLLGAERAETFTILLLVSLSFERVIYWLLKNGLKRRRPQEGTPGFRSLIQAADRFSFPSGHTSTAFLLATALDVVYNGPVSAMYLWATSIALSRVVLGVHYPGDTLAGALMGSGIALFAATQLGVS